MSYLPSSYLCDIFLWIFSWPLNIINIKLIILIPKFHFNDLHNNIWFVNINNIFFIKIPLSHIRRLLKSLMSPWEMSLAIFIEIISSAFINSFNFFNFFKTSRCILLSTIYLYEVRLLQSTRNELLFYWYWFTTCALLHIWRNKAFF